jgi:hypothetical protein
MDERDSPAKASRADSSEEGTMEHNGPASGMATTVQYRQTREYSYYIESLTSRIFGIQ